MTWMFSQQEICVEMCRYIQFYLFLQQLHNKLSKDLIGGSTKFGFQAYLLPPNFFFIVVRGINNEKNNMRRGEEDGTMK